MMKSSAARLRFSPAIALFALGAACAVGCTITTTDPAPVTPVTPVTGQDGGAEAGADLGAGCDFAEPNDTREQAKPIDLDKAYAGLCVSNPEGPDELDFFEITAPVTDLAGGYVEVQLSNVKNGGLGEIIVTSSLDNGVIFDSYTTDPGANVSGWLTVTPGAKYRIQVNRFGGRGERFAYDLRAKYTPIADAFEPNNTKEDAKAIEVGKGIQASAAAHSAKTEVTETDEADFYKVTLAAGAATVKMSSVPADFMCDVELLDAAGVRVAEKYQTDKGADCTLDATNLVGGSYLVKVHAFGGVPVRGATGSEVPAFVRLPYALAVTQ
jgi:hypothetical protein